MAGRNSGGLPHASYAAFVGTDLLAGRARGSGGRSRRRGRRKRKIRFVATARPNVPPKGVGHHRLQRTTLPLGAGVGGVVSTTGDPMVVTQYRLLVVSLRMLADKDAPAADRQWWSMMSRIRRARR